MLEQATQECNTARWIPGTSISGRRAWAFLELGKTEKAMDFGTSDSASAARASHALAAISSQSLDPAKEQQINRALAGVEQSLLSPDGLSGRPWFKHTVYAPGSYSGYAAEIMPGVSEALDRGNLQVLRREADSLAAALRRAALRLDDIARLAQQAASSPAAN